MSLHLHGSGGEWRLQPGANILGRSRDCALHFDDPRLSRQHARFTLDGERLSVEDLGSSNGTLVNGDRVAGPTVLEPGDMLVIGPLVFHVTAGDAPSAALDRREPTGPATPPPTPCPPEDPPPPPAVSENEEADELGPDAIAESSGDLRHSPALTASQAAPQRPTHQRRTEAMDSLPHEARQMQAEGQQRPVESTTSMLKPSRLARHSTDALSPNAAHLHADLCRARARRIIAGIGDPLMALFGGSLLALPLLLGSCGWALMLVGAGRVDGVPTIDPEVDAASFPALFTDLLAPATWPRLPAVLGQLRATDQQAFLVFFVGAALATLVWVLVPLFTLVAATMLKGAPWIHRQLDLVIRNHRTGFYLSPWRSCLRWVLALLLAPLAV
ncbi:MAG: FHA domain-containing protein, partial [Planctomycetota bacterium]